MGTASPSVSRLRRLGSCVLCVYAVGLFLMEGLLQAGAALALALALGLAVSGRLRLAADVRAYVGASGALCLWQLVSPGVALLTGAAERWPRGARYGQTLDTVAGAAVACVGSLGVPWGLVGALVAGGWGLATAIGLYQHWVLWTWAPPAFLKLNIDRLHENFGTEASPHYASGGFFFHRLRLAHGAVAVLGPALAVLGGTHRRRERAVAGVLVACLLVCTYVSFARAALGTAVAVCVLALLVLMRGLPRRVGLAVAAAAVVAVLATPAWSERAGRALENVASGERALAMSVGWRLVREHPLVGVGFGNHQPAALRTQAETNITELLATDSHNLWLTTWAETGLVGLLLLGSVHGLLAVALLRRHRAGSLVATGALLSFVGFHVLSLVHYLPFHPSVHLSFAFVWGLGLSGGGEELRD
jgi:O-antigen ligase